MLAPLLSPPTPLGDPGCHPSDETWLQRIVQMIAERRNHCEVLEALCQSSGFAATERQLAIFTIDGEDWKLSAKGDLNPRNQAAMACIQPKILSGKLLEAVPFGAGIPFREGGPGTLFPQPAR